MKIASRKRVYWFYLILAVLSFFFYLLVLSGNPHEVNIGYSDIMAKILNAPRIVKIALLYVIFVTSTSFIGFLVSNIIKDPSYQKSFVVSFVMAAILGIILFISYILR
jgi:hypothetical protein